MAGLAPNQIPVSQGDRIKQYVALVGSSPPADTNVYWSVRMGRHVTLNEGAAFDIDVRAGKLAPAVKSFPAGTVFPYVTPGTAPLTVTGPPVSSLPSPATNPPPPTSSAGAVTLHVQQTPAALSTQGGPGPIGQTSGLELALLGGAALVGLWFFLR